MLRKNHCHNIMCTFKIYYCYETLVQHWLYTTTLPDLAFNLLLQWKQGIGTFHLNLILVDLPAPVSTVLEFQ